MAEAGPLLGQVLELEIGAPGHGGFCVARHEGRVVFVRHALPGEVVRARVTEDGGGSYCRADAIEVLNACRRTVSRHRARTPGRGAAAAATGSTRRRRRPAGTEGRRSSASSSAASRGWTSRTCWPRSKSYPAGCSAGVPGSSTRLIVTGVPGCAGTGRTTSSSSIECPLGVRAWATARSWPSSGPGLNGLEIVPEQHGQRRRHDPDRAQARSAPQRSRTAGPGSAPGARTGPRGCCITRSATGSSVGGAPASGRCTRSRSRRSRARCWTLAAPVEAAASTVLELYAGAGAAHRGLRRRGGPDRPRSSASRAIRDGGRRRRGEPGWPRARRRSGEASVTPRASLPSTERGRPDLVVLDPPRTGAGARQ